MIKHFNYYYTLTLMKKEIKRLSNELSLPKKVVEKVYKAYWSFIKSHIIELPLKQDLTEEQFNALKTNFNLPNLGKLHCTYKRWTGIKRRGKYIHTRKNE